jgi:hypothetical protein
MAVLRAAQQHRSDARVAEGGALLRRYTGKTRIEGSNPSHSAKQSAANQAACWSAIRRDGILAPE